MTLRMNELQSRLISHISNSTDQAVLSPKEIRAYATEAGLEYRTADQIVRASSRVGRGKYDISMFLASDRVPADIAADADDDANTKNQQKGSSVMTPVKSSGDTKKSASVESVSNDEVYIPEADEHFVRWGNCKDIEMIIKSQEFYPTFITGLSGNGKTMMVEQACAKNKRQYVRVQVTPETDEDDLLGGFRLINGETVFQKGPVIKAMEAGAILLIDEIDRGSNKIMCLQGVLEGKPVMLKKTGEMIKPAKGFNVISTANTKGQGSDDGRFVAATIIDEAFLERFIITVEQPYPTLATERKIVKKHMEKYGCSDDSFAELLVTWADTIRKTFEDGGVDETISTRRLCHVIQTFSIFKDRGKAVELCVNRFDDETKDAFIDLYSKVDASIGESENSASSVDDMLDQAIASDPFAELSPSSTASIVYSMEVKR